MINCRVFLWQHWLQDIVCLDEARFSHITNTFCTFFAANSEGNCLVKTGESRRAPCKIRDWKGGLRPFVGGRERGRASPLLGDASRPRTPLKKGTGIHDSSSNSRPIENPPLWSFGLTFRPSASTSALMITQEDFLIPRLSTAGISIVPVALPPF